MAFNAKYYVGAQNELKQRKQSNAAKLEERRREIVQKFPEYEHLRKVLADTGARTVQVVFDAKKKDSLPQIQRENVAAAAK
ncbi:MAG: hypothetical protein FWF82_06650, partial [Oscillospiraceae bacterium]|nr:hypothetical protein [Oscillospiraceae bacterium]